MTSQDGGCLWYIRGSSPVIITTGVSQTDPEHCTVDDNLPLRLRSVCNSASGSPSNEQEMRVLWACVWVLVLWADTTSAKQVKPELNNEDPQQLPYDQHQRMEQERKEYWENEHNEETDNKLNGQMEAELNEQMEKERIEEVERGGNEQVEIERLEQMEKERLEQMEKERIEQMEKERLEQMEEERIEQTEKERLEQREEERIEQTEKEQVETEHNRPMETEQSQRKKRNTNEQEEHQYQHTASEPKLKKTSWSVPEQAPIRPRFISRRDTVGRADASPQSPRPSDCADILMSGNKTSGIYTIYPFTCTCSEPVQVWCDMETDGGGWTVVLNRQNQTPQLNFNRSWTDYKFGFGSPDREHYLGNDIIHRMTNSKTYGARLDMGFSSGSVHYRTLSMITVGSEATRYSLSYSTGDGNANIYCFMFSTSYFSTYDDDTGNCAASKGGGWWYGSSCRYNNPTGPYNHTLNYNCYNYRYSISSLQIKLRPALCDASVKTIALGADCHSSCR